MEQHAFASLATTIVVYVIAAIAVLAVWHGSIAIGAPGRLIATAEEDPRTLWLAVVVIIATLAGTAAFLGAVELFRVFVSS